jgi:transposase
MKLRTKDVRETVQLLDKIIKKYKEEKPEKKRDWRTYEQTLANRIKAAVRELEPLIKEAVSSIEFMNCEARGRKPVLTLTQKVELLLIKQLIEKSNREMSNMLVIFSLLSDIEVSYKSVERLYSDEGVRLVLMNLHTLILLKQNVRNPDCSGDGTGYSLTIKQHYASAAQKLKDKSNKEIKKKSNKGSKKKERYIFSFRLMDLNTWMYIGYGVSLNSEQEAFYKAMEMAQSTGIGSIRLDRYYSCQSYVKYIEDLFGKGVKIYLIPKKNATIKGTWKWKEILIEFVNDTNGYLEEYFKRNQSESGFSQDKRRFGWKISQKRPERIETHNVCTSLWHNMLWSGKN